MYNPEWRHARRLIGFGILALVAIFVIAMVVFMFVVAPNVAPMGYYPRFPFGFGWIGAFFLIFLLFGVMRWFFVPWGWAYRRAYWRGDEVHSILRERYARGELTREQFEQMKGDLEQHR